MRTRPAGDCQLEWLTLLFRRLWLTTQPPGESFRQLRSPPPQLMRPSWVCDHLPVGRGGRVQGRGVPSADNTSTEVPAPDPPVTRMAEILQIFDFDNNLNGNNDFNNVQFILTYLQYQTMPRHSVSPTPPPRCSPGSTRPGWRPSCRPRGSRGWRTPPRS